MKEERTDTKGKQAAEYCGPGILKEFPEYVMQSVLKAGVEKIITNM